MAEEQTEPNTEEDSTPAADPLAKGYWLHFVSPILLMMVNVLMLVALMGYAYSVYLEVKKVAQVTPDKRLNVMKIKADSGKRALFVSVSSVGVDKQLEKLAGSLDKHRQFYQDMLESEQAYSAYLHLQQNSVDHFAAVIGQSKVWQNMYLNSVLPLPTKSAQRENLIKITIDQLQDVPTLQ